MREYKIYVTDLTKAQLALSEIEISSTVYNTYLSISCKESEKMDVIKHLNKARIVVYDIEEY